MKVSHLDLGALRAALWTHRSLRSARKQLRSSGFSELTLPRLPTLPVAAERGVSAVLRRQPSTCLERAFVLQRWRAAHGEPRDVVVGVKGPSREFRAHAWLEDEEHAEEAGPFEELLRVHP